MLPKEADCDAVLDFMRRIYYRVPVVEDIQVWSGDGNNGKSFLLVVLQNILVRNNIPIYSARRLPTFLPKSSLLLNYNYGEEPIFIMPTDFHCYMIVQTCFPESEFIGQNIKFIRFTETFMGWVNPNDFTDLLESLIYYY